MHQYRIRIQTKAQSDWLYRNFDTPEVSGFVEWGVRDECDRAGKPSLKNGWAYIDATSENEVILAEGVLHHGIHIDDKQ